MISHLNFLFLGPNFFPCAKHSWQNVYQILDAIFLRYITHLHMYTPLHTTCSYYHSKQYVDLYPIQASGEWRRIKQRRGEREGEKGGQSATTAKTAATKSAKSSTTHIVTGNTRKWVNYITLTRVSRPEGGGMWRLHNDVDFFHQILIYDFKSRMPHIHQQTFFKYITHRNNMIDLELHVHYMKHKTRHANPIF